MPESKPRSKGTFQAPTGRSAEPTPSPRWFAPVMCTFLIVGLGWVVTYYISQTEYPIPGIGNWNLIAGFGILLVGFGFLTRWK